MNFWETTGAIIVALGFTEVSKKYLASFATDYLNRNKEIRKIGTKVQNYIAQLLDEDFKNPIVGEERKDLIHDVLRMDDDDDKKDFMEGIMLLLNLPVSLKTHRENSIHNTHKIEEAKTAGEEAQRLREELKKLNKLCNYYRHYPLIHLDKPWKGFKNKLPKSKKPSKK